MAEAANVLLIVSDQHNARCLSCAGHPDAKTPNIDRLAAEGVRFEEAYCQSPVCTPSRMSFLSSLYPSTTGYYGLYGPEPQQSITSIFRWFYLHGYRTGAVGKLHTPRYWIEADCNYVWDEFRDYPTYLEALGLYEQNDSRNFVPDRSMYSTRASAIPAEHTPEAVTAKHAARFISNEGEPKDRGSSRQPWFLWATFSRPHEPCVPSAPYTDWFDPALLTIPPTGEGNSSAKPLEHGHHGNSLPEKELRAWLAAYYGVLAQVDDGIGRILAHLEAVGDLENTIIAYTSDHGDYAGEQGRMEKNGGISHRAITRVPLVVRLGSSLEGSQETGGAASVRGAVSNGIVELVDVFPTICELSGTPTPHTVQGRSFAPLLDSPDAEFRDSALTENPHRKAVATKDYRFVANLADENEKDELYVRTSDPWEHRNVVEDPEHRESAQDGARLLLQRVVEARRPVTSMNGHWHGHIYDEDGRLDVSQSGERTAYW